MDIRETIVALTIAAGLFAGSAAAGPQSQEPAASPALQTVSLRSEGFELLPTLKSHMARLGTLMNHLFRNIDDPAQGDELVGVTREMKLHLARAAAFEPLALTMIIDPEKSAAANVAFEQCLRDAAALVAGLEAALQGGEPGAPRAALLRLDKKRRDCHSAFG